MQDRKKTISTPPVYLLLLILFFIFHGYVENFLLIPLSAAIQLVLIYSLSITVLHYIFLYFIGSVSKAGLITAALMALFFFFGSFHDLLIHRLGKQFLSSYTFVLPFCFLITTGVILYISRAKRSFKKASAYLNALLLILLLIESGILLNKASKSNDQATLPKGLQKCDSCYKPNIYLVIADEYAGHQELIDIFGYDNSPFENELKSLGFHYPDSSVSNYNFTPFSVASILNYDYLPFSDSNRMAREVPIVMESIKNNNLIRFLSLHGYKIVNNSIFDLEGEPAATSSEFFPAKSKYITAQTLFSRLYRDLGYHLITKLKLRWVIKRSMYNSLNNNRFLYQKTLETKSDFSHPLFSYSHLHMPHTPYYFDENGAEMAYDSLFDSGNRRLYIGYLKYCNKQYLNLFTTLIKRETVNPPIIIFLSDHGYRARYGGNEFERKYNFMNTIAVYNPYVKPQGLYNGMSAVNVFRIFLNEQFSQRLPLLKDSVTYLKD
ncbi:MAG: hypothetical protein JWP69_20 [Flaviaesturariibacter sp.]|nr:hypothetical protein [Flaviaesturariibacter sp.]